MRIVPPHLCRLFRWCETDAVVEHDTQQGDVDRERAVNLLDCQREVLCSQRNRRRPRHSDIIVLMTTNLTISAEAKAESDRRWAQWIAVGARRDRERQKRAARLTIVIAIVLAIWLAKVLVLG